MKPDSHSAFELEVTESYSQKLQKASIKTLQAKIYLNLLVNATA